MHTRNPIYSPESISFQNDRFFKALTGIVDRYRDDSKGAKRTEFELELVQCVKDHTNINFDFSIGDSQMMTEPPMIDKNNPMLEGYGWQDTTLSKTSLMDIRASSKKQLKATLDLNASYVGGYFAEMKPVRMYLNAPMIYGNKGLFYKIFDGAVYTSAEIAAILLHEVGHIWSFLEMMVRFRTTTQVLASMARELDGTEDHGKRELIIKEASSQLNLETVDAIALSTKSNLTVYTIIISNVARLNRSQTGDGYDINSFETLSDQFAVRHGAGRALATGLDKLYKGTIYRRNFPTYLFVEVFKVFLFGLGIVEFGMGAILGGANTFAILATIIAADSHHDWYEKAGARFKRVRNQLVEELKNPALSKETSDKLREDIDVIDKLNEKYSDYTQLLGLVYDYLIPAGISKRKQIEFTQSLEELSATKLFYYANKLKHI